MNQGAFGVLFHAHWTSYRIIGYVLAMRQNDMLPNHKHEMFAQLLYQGEMVEDAYVEAGYRHNNGNAYRLKGQDSIQQRINQLAEQARIKAGVTANSLSRELDAVRIAAFRAGQYGVAATAIMGKAKLHGLLTDKVEHSVSSLAALLKEIDGDTRGLNPSKLIDITPDDNSQDD